MDVTEPPEADHRTARAALRRLARKLAAKPSDAGAHLERLRSALELPGSEAIQGALADVFTHYGAPEKTFKRTALNLAAERLDTATERAFRARLEGAPLPPVNTLATRWSVLAQPSADVATRIRRCGSDDSRWLAGRVLRALEQGDLSTQEEFLLHCATCEDKLAFMLARREILRSGRNLPEAWLPTQQRLERAGLTPGSLQKNTTDRR